MKDQHKGRPALPGTPRIGRRGFFGASVGMAAAAVTGGAVGGRALPAFATETGDARTRARYQPDSPHVQEFYEVNRLVWPEER